MSRPITDRAGDAQRAAETHLERINRFQDEMEQSGDYNQDGPDTAGPWDGCGTCEIRESIAAAWPHALAHAADLVAAHGLGRTITAIHRMLLDEARKATLAGLDVPA